MPNELYGTLCLGRRRNTNARPSSRKQPVPPSLRLCDYILPLPPATLLDELALYEFAVAAEGAPDADVFYADEDKVDEAGERHSPYFKTGFDPDLMLGRDALGLPVVYRSSLIERLGGLREGSGPYGVALHDLALRACVSAPSRFIHVPVVLCHRFDIPGASPDWDAAAAREAIRRYLDAVGEHSAIVHPAPLAPYGAGSTVGCLTRFRLYPSSFPHVTGRIY